MIVNRSAFRLAAWCTIAGGGVAFGMAAQAGPMAAASVRTSSAQQRQDVSITVYNQNFGLVREVREIEIGKGRVALEFRDVAAQIQPETVAIKSMGAPTSLSVLEQNYRYDLLSPQKLLEKYVGRSVKVYRWNEKLGKDEPFDAEVLAVNGSQSVLKIGSEITYDFPGRIAFPEVPANLIAKPSLVWLLDSEAPKHRVEVTYLTRNMNWSADYVFVLNESDTLGDLTGWVTLNNQSGAAYENARLKLVAGDVQRVSSAQTTTMAYAREMDDAKKPGRAFREEGFFEYHLYTLNQPTTLLQNEQKQVTLLEASGAKIDKRLIFFGSSYHYRSTYGQLATNQKVGVYLDLQNRESNHLGMPLPKGTVRVYKADKSGAKQFIGEDRIDHTPRDEKIRIKMGEAFDVVADRRQMTWRTLGTCSSESDWEITLRNHKDSAEQVELNEPVGGDWEIVSSSHPSTKEDAHTFTFKVGVPSRGETKVKYRVRIKWC